MRERDANELIEEAYRTAISGDFLPRVVFFRGRLYVRNDDGTVTVIEEEESK